MLNGSVEVSDTAATVWQAMVLWAFVAFCLATALIVRGAMAWKHERARGLRLLVLGPIVATTCLLALGVAGALVLVYSAY